MLRKEFWVDIKPKLWGNKFWSPSYCVVSCGGVSLDVIKQYIEQQRQPAEEKHIQQSIYLTGRKRDKQKRWLA